MLKRHRGLPLQRRQRVAAMGKLDGAMFHRLLLDDRQVLRQVEPGARSGKSNRTSKMGPAAVNASSRTGAGVKAAHLARSNSASAIGQQSFASATGPLISTSRGRGPADGAPPEGAAMPSASCSACSARFLPECSVFADESEPGRFLCRNCVSGRNSAGGPDKAECSKCLRIVQRFSEIHRSESGKTAIVCDDCLLSGPPRCAACSQRASSPFARLGDYVYHKDCLRCSLCSAWIKGEASHTPPFGLICARCGEGVSGQSEELERVIIDDDDDCSVGNITTTAVATSATPLRSPTDNDITAGTSPQFGNATVAVATSFSTQTTQEQQPSTAASSTSTGEEMDVLEWDPASALPVLSGEVWYHVAKGGRLAVRSTRASQGTPESAPILRSLTPLLPGGVCSMRLKVTCCGADKGVGTAAVDLDFGLATSTVLCEQHSSSWRRRQPVAAQLPTAAEGWLLLCSGPSAARCAAAAETRGMVGQPQGSNSVSSRVSRKVARLPNRAASWHCELHSGDLVTIAVEPQPHRTREAGNAPTGKVSFLLNSVRILQADLSSNFIGPHDAEDGDVAVHSGGRRPVYHVVAAVRQPGVGLTLGCDEDVRLYL